MVASAYPAWSGAVSPAPPAWSQTSHHQYWDRWSAWGCACGRSWRGPASWVTGAFLHMASKMCINYVPDIFTWRCGRSVPTISIDRCLSWQLGLLSPAAGPAWPGPGVGLAVPHQLLQGVLHTVHVPGQGSQDGKNFSNLLLLLNSSRRVSILHPGNRRMVRAGKTIVFVQWNCWNAFAQFEFTFDWNLC